MAGSWHEIQEATSLAGIRIIIALHGVLGRSGLMAVLLPVSFFYWATTPSLRSASKTWLKAAGASSGIIQQIRHVHRFAETILDKLTCACGGEIPLKIEGDEVFDGDSEQTGAVILTSHTGCQELLSRASRLHTNHKIVVLQHTRHAEKFNELLSRINPAPSSVVFREVSANQSALAMELSDLIDSGAYVVIAGDRTPISSSDSVEALFFGRRAEFPSGGALLALLLKRPLRAMICTRNPEAPSGYLVTFHSIDESPSAPRSHRREWISDKMQIWAGLLEDRLKQSPYDWFNFYNFWRSK